MNDDLKRLFSQSSSITFIDGKRDSGKTDLALLLLESGKRLGLFDKIACNVRTYNDPNIGYICYFDRFEHWLSQDGTKGFFLDELGTHLYKMSFASRMAKLIMRVCQLARKYGCHLIGAAPSSELVNKLFFNSDLLDCRMEKVSRKKVVIINSVTKSSRVIQKLPRTSIRFITKDVAIWEERDPTWQHERFDALQKWDQAWRLYLVLRSVRRVAQKLDVSPMQVTRLLNSAVKRLDLSDVTK